MAQQINLLEPSLRPVRQWCRGRDLLLMGGALATAVLVHYQFERQALARVLATSAAASGGDAAAPADTTDTQVQERQAHLQSDEMLLKTVAGLVDLPHDSAQRLQGLIGALPPNAWLKEVEFSGARGVRIAGGALQAAEVAEFSRRLGREPAFKGLPLQVFALDAPAAAASQPAAHGFVFSSLDPAAREAR